MQNPRRPAGPAMRKTNLYGAFCAVFCVLFAFAAVDSLCNNRSGSFTYRVPLLALGAVLCGGILFLAWHLWRRFVPPLCVRAERIAVCGRR